MTADGDLAEARAGDAVTVTIEDQIDIARGDVLTPPDGRPEVGDQFSAHLIWMSEDAMLPGRSYLMRVATRSTPAQVTSLKYAIDVNTFQQIAARSLQLNEIGVCNISTSQPVAFDAYTDNRTTGAFILIDRQTNATVGAGMLRFALAARRTCIVNA